MAGPCTRAKIDCVAEQNLTNFVVLKLNPK